MTKQQRLRILAATGITASILVVLYYIRGLYPFGGNSLAWLDGTELYMPMLFARYDILHGASIIKVMQSCFGGGSAYNMLSGFILSPLSLPCLLMPRELLVYYPNIMVALCALLSTITAGYCLEKLYPSNNTMNGLLAVAYGFSGYLINIFCVLPWLIYIPLFPLFIISFKRLLQTGKGLWFALLMAYSVALNVQIGAMLLLFVLFGAGIYAYFYCERCTRKRLLYRVGIYTFFALLISALYLFPNVSKTLFSSRSDFAAGRSSLIMQSSFFSDIKTKLSIIISPLPLGVLIGALFSKRLQFGRKKLTDGSYYRGGVLTVVLLLLIFTAICQPSNLMWHLGSYAMFPVRYGFIINFLMVMVCSSCIRAVQSPTELACIQEEVSNKSINKKWIIEFVICALLCALSLILCIWLSRLDNAMQHTPISSILPLSKKAVVMALCSVMLCVSGILIYRMLYFKKRTGRTQSILTACIAMLTIICGIFTGTVYGLYTKTDMPSYNAMQNMYADNLGGDSLTRMKEARSVLIRNFGYETGVMSLGGFSAYVPSGYVDTMVSLGYTSAWTSIVSTGGTLMTDALLRNGYIIGANQNDGLTSLYSEYAGYGEYTVYKNDMLLPEAFVIGNGLTEVSLNTNTPLENANLIYKTLSGDTAELISIYTDYTVDANGHFVFDISNIEETASGYALYIDPDAKRDTFEVYVDNRLIAIHDQYDEYAFHRIVELGVLARFDSSVTITVEPLKASCNPDGIKIGLLDISKLQKLCGNLSQYAAEVDIESNHISVNASATDDGYVFIPIQNAEYYRCKVNGNSVTPITAFGSFMAIPVSEGESTIVIKESITLPVIIGAIVTLLGIALLILHELLHKKGVDAPTWWQSVVAVTYTIILCAGTLTIYVIGGIVGIYNTGKTVIIKLVSLL